MPESPAFRVFEGDEVTDAGLVGPSAVVDHEHLAGRGAFEGFEDDVDAAVVARGPDPADDVGVTPRGPHGRGCAADRETQAHDRIGDVGCRQVQVRALQLERVHGRVLLGGFG